MRDLFSELRRRKVYRVGVVYGAVAFVVWQVADIAFPSLGLPDQAVAAVLLVTVLGFPVALVLAWAYEVKPEPPRATLKSTDGQESTQSPPAAAQPNSVAILPFENMSSEEESGYFAEGITEEITNVLAGISDLHVAARTSAFSFRGSQRDVRDIGRTLNVSFVVEGSVRRARDTLRITAQLIDTSTGFHVWSERFDRPNGDVFQIQDEIARAVAERLSRHVQSGAAPRRVTPTNEMSAYDEYLRGLQLLSEISPEALLEAASYFEKCIALDPRFAPAKAALSEALTLQAMLFHERPGSETGPDALQEAEAALELDPELPEAHLARALVAMYYEWDHQTAKASFDRARALGPSVSRIHMWLEFYATYVEHDYAAAIAAIDRARELSPVDPAIRVREATVRYLFGDLKESEALIRGMLAESPDASILHTSLGNTLMLQGRTHEAIEALERAIEIDGPVVAWLAIVGLAYGVAGLADKAQGILQQLEARSRERYVSHFWLAIAQAGTGDLDAAFASLDAACRDRDGALLFLPAVPRFSGLHADPRCAGILRTIGLSHLIPQLESAS
jgi:TolB-like protein